MIFLIVIYAEKPDMGRKIASALCDSSIKKQDGYIDLTIKGQPASVTWGFGHMYGLQDAKEYHEDYAKWDLDIYPVVPESFELCAKKGVSKQIKVIKNLFDKADTIINATDADREGELIFSYVFHSVVPKTKISRKSVKRMWMQTTTKDGLQDAYNTAKDISLYQSVESAARIRAIMDWLAGINLTVFATKRFPKFANTPISIGRVQTPTLALIVNREKEIAEFKSHPFWDILATFNGKNGQYSATYKEEKISDKDKAQKIFDAVNNKRGIVKSISSKTEKRQVPLLYDLTSLQMAASSKLGFTAKKTLDIAQKLYEEQYTTYPRTTSCFLPEDMKSQIKSVLDNFARSTLYSKYLSGITYAPFTSRHFNDKKVESHFAIVPTGKSPDSLTGDELKLFDLIAKSVIRIAYPDAEILITNVITDVSGYEFISKGEVIKNTGWFVVDAMPDKKTTLPLLEEGESVTGKYSLKEGKTQPPKRYTEKTLISAMKNAGDALEDEEAVKLMKDAGIGTPATRAGIIETIINREYVKREKGKFVPTQIGIEVINFLPIEILKSAKMTGEMEKRLSDIEEGNEDPDDVLQDFEKNIREWCKVIKALPIPTNESRRNNLESIGSCPICGAEFVDYGKFCKCKSDSCGFSINKEICKKTLSDKNIQDLLAGKLIVLKGCVSKAGKKFDAPLKIKDGKVAFAFEEQNQASVVGKCPKCGGNVVSINGAFGKCDNESCDFKISFELCQKKLSELNVKELLEGKTIQVKGFTSKAGKKFDAGLTLDETYKLSFVFDNNPNDSSDEATVIGSCPKCGSDVLNHKNYCKCNSCGFSINKEICQKRLSDQNIQDLLDGKTIAVDGMTSKKGNTFNANLSLDSDYKVAFSFK